MRIATWNVNGLGARLGFVRHWLEARKPDIVGVQELKMTDEQFPHLEFASLGYHVVTHGQKAWNGVAVLARTPPTVVRCGLPGEEPFGARMICTRVGDLDFVTVYCPNGKFVGHEDFPRKLAWLDTLGSYVEQNVDPARPTILCGDFNLCPAGIDSWNEASFAGQIFHTDEERKRFRRLLDHGLKDVFREVHPDLQAFSWWDYRAGAFHKKQGLRIDFLLATQPALDRVRSVEIDREYRKKKDELIPSDHAPVIADLD